MSYVIYENELVHFGTKGMKWGVRKYQNPDGTLTEAGKQRYNALNKKGVLNSEGQRRLKEGKRIRTKDYAVNKQAYDYRTKGPFWARSTEKVATRSAQRVTRDMALKNVDFKKAMHDESVRRVATIGATVAAAVLVEVGTTALGVIGLKRTLGR